MTEHSATAIAAAIRERRLDPQAIAIQALGRAQATQNRLNAFTRIDREKALAEAATIPARLAAGEHLPLAGVPLIVKDNIWVGGWPITQGSRLFADHIAPRDAIAVERVRRAGAVIIGIGTCSEFACKGVTTTPLYGATRHPMNAELTPGGSSGGNAAALADGVAPLALGTDAGGSSRRPPAHCGIVGFKPSQDAVPHPFGFPEPFWGITCISPMARNVRDATILFDVIARRDARDPESREISVLAASGQRKIATDAMLGLDAPADTFALQAFAAAMDALHDMAGCAFFIAAPFWPHPDKIAILNDVQYAGLAALHGDSWRRTPGMIDPDICVQIERGMSMTGAQVAASLEVSREVRLAAAAFFANYDLMISLTAPCMAWRHDQLGPAEIGGKPVNPRGHTMLTPLWNHAHCPAISIPCGHGPGGLPIGLQIAGPIGADHAVLAFAAEAEKALAEAGLWIAS